MRKIVGFTSGYFDIMHPGHVMMLGECKRYCDYLIVAVHEYKTKTKQPDGRNKEEPIWSPKERLMMVDANKYVDENEPWQLIKNNKERAGDVLNILVIVIAKIAIFLAPIMPNISENILNKLGLSIKDLSIDEIKKENFLNMKHKIKKPEIIFHKIEND